MARIFAKRSQGFRPDRHPYMGFGDAEDRDALISAAAPGDLVVLAGTQDEATLPAERGRLLGIAEFAPIPVNLGDESGLTGTGTLGSAAVASPTWLMSLPVVRAWLFVEPRLKLIDVLREQLTFEVTGRAVQLDEVDARTVLAIPKREIDVPLAPHLVRLLAVRHLEASCQPTTGPTPVHWAGTVARDAHAPAWTYVMRFGRRDLWKVGHSQDLDRRLRDVSLHVPVEETGEAWHLVTSQHWPTSVAAHAMEQRVFRFLEEFRTTGERVRCSEVQLQSAWTASL